MSRRSASAALLLGILVLALGALLWGRNSGPAASPTEPGPAYREREPPASALSARTPVAPATQRADGSAGEETRRIEVSVVAAEDGHPIEGADVSVLAVGRADDGPLPTLSAVVLAAARTDASGLARLEVIGGAGPRRLLATAAGRASAEGPWDTQPEATLRLEPGRTIEGLVVDPADRPVAGIRVRARAVEVPEVDDDLVAATASSAWRTTSTDAEGRFRLEGLWSGTYAVMAYGDGWRFRAPRALGGDPWMHATAGAEGLRLVVRPVRAFRFVLEDEVLHVPIPYGYSSDVSVVVGESPGVVEQMLIYDGGESLFDGRSWTRLNDPIASDGALEGWVELEPGTEPATEIRVYVAVAGYDGIATNVRLRLPSRVRAEAPERFSLRPAPDRGISAGRGVVVVTEEGDDDGYWHPEGRDLLLRDSTDPDRSVVVRGRPKGPTGWTFASLPEGRFEARVTDGEVVTEPRTIQIAAARAVELRVPRPRATGVALDVRDGADRPIHGIDFLVAYEEPGTGRGHHIPEPWTRPRWSATHRAFRAPVASLPPGDYSFTAQKEGYSHVRGPGTVTVRSGEVTVLRIRFAERAPIR
ncbi:MAG TPA: carboxypeptidase regulatory-like domain-containing protein [Planctomycetota bacterium]|nr:carboxypeptidase regulatory-like domain-containing protein [Planctomycetota bacterium]